MRASPRRENRPFRRATDSAFVDTADWRDAESGAGSELVFVANSGLFSSGQRGTELVKRTDSG